uniref:G protein-coupled receptor n=1 Tax=Pristionchus pacificus TaxID=54126 RepID=A0A8R1YW08_PRIPA
MDTCTEFDSIRDFEYVNCSFTEDSCSQLKGLHYASNFGSSPIVIMTIILSVVALILHLFYSIFIHIVWVREKFKGNKRSAIVADRSATAIFTIILLYVTLILWHTIGFGYTTASILLVIAACVYLWIANNFFLMTIMLYVAVMNPIFYSKRLKFRHCFMIRWGLWAVVITVGVNSIFPCPVETCQYPFAISVLSLLCFSYAVMLICYAVIMLKIRNRIKTMAKLSMRVCFGVITIVYVSAISCYTISVVNFDNLSGLGPNWKEREKKELNKPGEKFMFPCTRLESESALLLCCNLMGAMAICWLIGMTIDSVFNLRFMDLRTCGDYDSNIDQIYINCSNSNDACAKLKDLHLASAYTTGPLVISVIVLSVFTLFFHLLYSILIYIVWIREKFRGLKRTAIVADRSAATIFSITLIYALLILWHASGFTFITASIILVTAAVHYLWIANNFFCMTILMYVAVMQPIFYKTRLKLKHLLFTGWGLALVGTTIGILLGFIAASLLFPSDSIFPCPISTCQYPFAISTLILLCIAYLLMVICYFIIIVRLRKRIHILALFSLRVSFGVITLVYVSAIVTYTIAIVNFESIAGLGDSFASPCSRLNSGSSLLLCCNLVGATTICWLIGMTIDALFNLATEAKLYEHFSLLRKLKGLVIRPKPESIASAHIVPLGSVCRFAPAIGRYLCQHKQNTLTNSKLLFVCESMHSSLLLLCLFTITFCCHVAVINRCAFDIRSKEKLIATGHRAAIGLDSIGFYVKNASNEKVIGKIRRDTMKNKVFNSTVVFGGGTSLVLGTNSWAESINFFSLTMQNAVVVLSDGVSGCIGNDGKNATMTSVCCRESVACIYDYIYPSVTINSRVIKQCRTRRRLLSLSRRL